MAARLPDEPGPTDRTGPADPAARTDAADPDRPGEESGPAAGVPDLAALPAPLRSRVTGLAAEVLPRVVDLPGPLRRVAEFAPARRARLGAGQVGAALADPGFRARVSTQVAALLGPDAPGTDRAALAWLAGEAGALATYLATAAGEPERAARETDERWQRRVEELQRDLRREREQQREQVAGLREDNHDLRRKLGEARARARGARQEAEAAGRRADRAESERARERAAAEAEARRLRAELVDAQAQLTQARGAERVGRGEASLRARLLLETVQDAAAGLRRELALPAVEGSPAARVEEELEARRGSRDPSAAGALGTGSPALLAQLLALPRSRLLVDGYNVTKSSWPDSSLEAQRARLLRELAPLVARTGAETTVVFDAAHVRDRPVVAAPRGVRVLFSPPGVLADDVLRELVAAEPPGRAVVVVTSDREVADDVRRAGHRVASASALAGLLGGA